MRGEQFAVESVDGGADSGSLDQDIRTVGVVLDHTADAADLSFDPAEPVDQALVLRFVAFFCFMTVTGLFIGNEKNYEVIFYEQKI